MALGTIRSSGCGAIIIVLLMCHPPSVRAEIHAQPHPKQADIIADYGRDQAARILSLLYHGHIDSAYAQACTDAERVAGHPLPLLMKARVLRECLREHDDDKSLIKENAAPVYDILRETIGLCDSLLELDDPPISLRFYRGWAHMFKAQVDVLSGSYWSAGQEAKKGKHDLEAFLEFNPDHADAKGLLGMYLYFADMVPSIVKFIKILLLIPGGDRDRGLEYLEYASNHSELLTLDQQITYLTMLIMFEGRFEEGIEGFMSLYDRHPYYTRIAEFLVLMAPFSPRDVRRLQSAGRSALSHATPPQPRDRHSDAPHLIRYQRSYSLLLFSDPARARQEFEAIIEAKPERPDWYYPLTLMNYGVLEANSGNAENAVRLFQTVLGMPSAKRFHEVLSEMIGGVDLAEAGLDDLSASVVDAIYERNIEDAREMLDAYRRSHGETIHYYFYLGELNLMADRPREAVQAYYSTLEKKAPAVHSMYRMYAAVRLAEIMGSEKEYESARQFLEKALDFYQMELFIDLLIKARMRFYANLDAGKIQPPQPMLISGILKGE